MFSTGVGEWRLPAPWLDGLQSLGQVRNGRLGGERRRAAQMDRAGGMQHSVAQPSAMARWRLCVVMAGYPADAVLRRSLMVSTDKQGNATNCGGVVTTLQLNAATTLERVQAKRHKSPRERRCSIHFSHSGYRIYTATLFYELLRLFTGPIGPNALLRFRVGAKACDEWAG
jgi:hypothetical protein